MGNNCSFLSEPSSSFFMSSDIVRGLGSRYPGLERQQCSHEPEPSTPIMQMDPRRPKEAVRLAAEPRANGGSTIPYADWTAGARRKAKGSGCLPGGPGWPSGARGPQRGPFPLGRSLQEERLCGDWQALF